MSEEKPKEKYWQRLNQSEAGYLTVSPDVARACASCRFFDVESDWPCMIVMQNDPYPIVAGGICDEYRSYPVRDENWYPTGQEMNPAIPPPLNPSVGSVEFTEIVEVGEMAKKPVLHMTEDEMEAEDKPKKALGLLDIAVENLNKFIEQFRPYTSKSDIELTGFKVFEDGRFLAWWSNNFKDKQDEIISEYAIDEFIDKANKGLEPMPELWWMHIRGTKHGQAEKMFRVGHFALAIGHLDDAQSNPLVPFFKSWYAKQKNVTMSHGFFYKPSLKQNGVYHHIRTYEISSLIAGREANPYTSFEVNKMSIITETQRADLEREFGKDFTERIVQHATEQGKALESQNVAFKSLPSGFGSETLLLLGAVKTVEEDALKAISESTEAHKEAKDVGNRLDKVEKTIGDFDDKIFRLTEKLGQAVDYIKELTQIQPPASKSPLSAINKDDKEANFLEKKNEEQGQKFVPILEQMRKMGDFTPPTVTD